MAQPLLLVPSSQTVRLTEDWHVIKDGDAVARELYNRHYSRFKYKYKDGRYPKLFIGPGEKLALISERGDAVFCWRKYIDDSLGHLAVWCSIFRNESQRLSSDLILQAERVAQCRWPGEVMYTHVDTTMIKSPNPGFCFKCAGWGLMYRSRSTDVLGKPQ